jgi:hypothetical protein
MLTRSHRQVRDAPADADPTASPAIEFRRTRQRMMADMTRPAGIRVRMRPSR